MTTPVTLYPIEKHKHLYAKWCAAAAYGRGLAGGGNSLAFQLIEASGLGQVTGPEQIGQNVDKWQMSFMKQIEAEAARVGGSASKGPTDPTIIHGVPVGQIVPRINEAGRHQGISATHDNAPALSVGFGQEWS